MTINSLNFDAQELREKILDLAMRGKLVKQDPNDEPASVLLKKEADKKKKLFKEKKIKKKDLNLPIFRDEPLPKGWVKTTLKEITTPLDLNDGDWIVSKDMDPLGKIKLVQLGSIGEGIYKEKGFKYISEETFEKLNCTEIKPGYLLINRLISKEKMLAARLPTIEGKIITAVDVCWVAPSDIFDLDFMKYQLLSPTFQAKVKHLAAGSTRKRISKGNLTSIELNLPPLEEQSRIADKVAQLFALLRKVESSTNQYEELQELLQNKVLDLAMQGKLVEQRDDEEPASVLLEKIRAEKAELIKEKKIKKTKPLPEITNEEKPFDIPDSWEWVRLGEVVSIKGGKRVPKGNKLLDHLAYIPYLRVADMKKRTIDFNNLHYATKDIYEKIKKYTISSKDIYFSIAGTIGKVGEIPKELDGSLLTENAAKLQLFSELCNKNLLIYFLNSSLVKYQHKKITSRVAQPKLALVKLQGTIIPLPPLNEQKRIATKIEELAALIGSD